MLQLTVQLSPELWDEKTEEFIEAESITLQLEHSLVSLSKWESKWHKPFLSAKDLSDEETLDYVRYMTITPNVRDDVYDKINTSHISQIVEYINAPMTATTFSEDKTRKNNREIITAEVIYYWLIALNIPFECQYWHLNRLLTLIRVCNIKNEPPKKMKKQDIMSRNAALNAARKQQMNTKG